MYLFRGERHAWGDDAIEQADVVGRGIVGDGGGFA